MTQALMSEFAQFTFAMQGCGSVLATQNLDTINFTYSTQQRSSTSQPFIKPRLIARPTQAHLKSAAAVQSQSDSAHATGPADVTQSSDSCHPATDSPCKPSAQDTGHQAKQSDSAQLSAAAASGQCASSTDGLSAIAKPEDQHPYHKPLGGVLSGLSTLSQTNEGSILDAGGGTRHLSTGASVSAQFDSGIADVEQELLREAIVETQGVADDSRSEAVALLGWLEGLRLRYFTPREVANLHSFPDSFSFPAHVTRRQQYALLGNSLSVAVVADLLTYMLEG